MMSQTNLLMTAAALDVGESFSVLSQALALEVDKLVREKVCSLAYYTDDFFIAVPMWTCFDTMNWSSDRQYTVTDLCPNCNCGGQGTKSIG